MAAIGNTRRDTDPTVSVEELAAATDPVIVDVRTPGEFAQSHIDGALLIPLDELDARAGEVPPADIVYVICHLGQRSARGAAILRDHDRVAMSVRGGMSAWEAAGFAVSDTDTDTDTDA